MSCLLLLFVATSGTCAESNDEREQTNGQSVPAFRRWAIIASPDVREDGLPDLLTAGLSQRENLRLVERDQIALAMRELNLAACFGPDASAARLKLGQLVDADTLVFLSLVKEDLLHPQKSRTTGTASAAPPHGDRRAREAFLKIVISECSYGARLHITYLAFDGEHMDALCLQCIREIEDTQQRFAGGIRAMIGVTPFVSKNLTHRYDHLQDAYANLLQHSLALAPGIAVLELEEARAIAEELQRSGDELKRRVVPLFAEGEFEVATTGDRTHPVKIQVGLGDGKQRKRTIIHESVPTSGMAELLGTRVASKIVKAVGATPSTLSREEQFRLLAARAATFGQLGALDQSIRLREAALLLDPDDAEQRLALLDERHRAFLSGSWERKLARQIQELPGDEVRRQVREQQLAQWQIRMNHVEHLIRRRLVNPREAGYLVASTTDYWRWPRGVSARFTRYSPNAEDRPRAEAFFWRTASLIPDLDYEIARGVIRPGFVDQFDQLNLTLRAWDRAEQDWRWITAVGRAVWNLGEVKTATATESSPRGRGEYDHGETSGKLVVLLTEIAPSDAVASCDLIRRTSLRTRFSAEERRRFYERLRESRRRGAVIYGRYGLLQLEVEEREDYEMDAQLLAEADDLLRALGEFPQSAAIENYAGSVHFVRQKIARHVEKTPDAANEKRHPPPVVRVKRLDQSKRISFETVEGPAVDWIGLVRCGEALDLIWSERAVHLMKSKGSLQAIYADEQSDRFRPAVLDAQWDGRYVWVATNGRGINAYAPDGSEIARFTRAAGLPPHDTFDRARDTFRPLLIHAVEPGSILAVGTFGSDRRVWFAMLKLDGTTPRVNVFHKLTKISSGRADEDDPELIFSISWLLEYRSEATHKQHVLVKRLARSGLDHDRRPLSIDLETLDVTIQPVPFHVNVRQRYDQRNVCKILPGGCVLHTKQSGVVRFPLSSGKSAFAPPDVLFEIPVHAALPRLLARDGKIYLASRAWHRIDPRTLEHEPLTDGLLPEYRNYRHYAVSAHYGLVAWSRGRPLNRVFIDHPNPPPDDPLLEYHWMPEEHRDKHARAAEAMRRRGAIVAKMPSYIPGEGAVVYLTEDWRGSDADLRHLANLYKLVELHLVRAPVTNEGLANLGLLPELMHLTLYETRITDEGLIHLKDSVPNLWTLRLEGHIDGNEFTSDGLAYLADLKELWELTLYGSGFADHKGLDHLRRIPKLRGLKLHDTAFTKAGLNELKETKKVSWIR